MNKTKRLLKNSKNKTCKSKNMTVCCPHMIPTNGKYATTTRRHRLKYNNKNYYFKTCCNACASSMKELALSLFGAFFNIPAPLILIWAPLFS